MSTKPSTVQPQIVKQSALLFVLLIGVCAAPTRAYAQRYLLGTCTGLNQDGQGCIQGTNTGESPGIEGDNSGSPGAIGVLGTATGSGWGVKGTTIDPWASNAPYSGIYGVSTATNGNGVGVYGLANTGVRGDSNDNGTGVVGTSVSGTGVMGSSSGGGPSVYGTNSGSGAGVYGITTGSGNAVYGTSPGTAIAGVSTGNSVGVMGTSGTGTGVMGSSSGGGPSVYGTNSGSGAGVYGATTGSGYAVFASGKAGGTTAWMVGSDARFKMDMKDSRYGLAEVLKLRPITYRLKEGSIGTQLGFVAQEVQKITPEVVRPDVTSGMLYLSYTELVPVVVKALQEQETVIRRQQQMIESLQKGQPIASSVLSGGDLWSGAVLGSLPLGLIIAMRKRKKT